MNASPPPGECRPGGLRLASPSPTAPLPPEATHGQAAPDGALPLVEPISVVAKVAKLLANLDHYPRLEYPIRWKDGYLHQKVRTSLHPNHQL